MIRVNLSTRANIKDIIELGSKYGCELRSEKYKNVNTKLDWSCNTCSYDFSKTLATIKKNGLKCPKCNPKIPHNKGVKGVSDGTREKMRQAKVGGTPYNKGSTMDVEQRIKLSCHNQGIDVSDFDGFKTEDARRERAQFEQHPVKIECLIKNNYTCSFCNTAGVVLNVHHKNSWKFFTDQRFDINNLACLCKGCHKTFHKIYGNGKKNPNTEEQYIEFLSKSKNHRHIIYVLAGVSGSGKSWVCEQLRDQFHYIPMDKYKKNIGYMLNVTSNDKPILIDPTTNVSTYFKRLSDKYDVALVVIIEDKDTIIKRLEARGGNFTKSIARRISRMKALSSRSIFSGTSHQVLDFLQNKKPGI